ncbi:alpha-L-rhamnosidase [Devosia sp.]|uniref:alpha-L-rhamnosidase n=1 Tax=Devosia sp. TaxID=1871048 RepID=UPI002617BA4C|nr:alpha-L-rhamnosidase [Devosia sp.]
MSETKPEGEEMPLTLIAPQPPVVDAAPKNLGWHLPTDWSAQRQIAYELEVATTSDFAAGSMVWTTGRVVSDSSQHVDYQGPLSAHQRYYWRVRIWGDAGAEASSEPAWFETAKLSAADCRGEMIGPQTDPGAEKQAPSVAKRFTLASKPASARLYITSFGIFRCFINGLRVGADELTPGWTSYRERLGYLTYDIAEHLQAGDNSIEVWLGDGWYRGEICWPAHRIVNAYGDRVGCLAELRMVDEAGTARSVVTDSSWTSGLTPVLMSGIYPGEIYDARLEGETGPVGGVDVLPLDKSTLVAQEAPPIRELPHLQPVDQRSIGPGVTLVDFGQNVAGAVKLTLSGERGATVRVNFAEILDAEGKDLNSTSFRGAKVQLDYTLKGGGEESYQPVFTFMGFRHARVTITGQARLVSIESVPFTSDLVETGSFSCSNPLINRLHENARWSLRGNFLDVPMDCPQRDERLGWTGDAQIFSPTASYLRDTAPFFRKWLRDMVADQREDGAISHVVPHPNRYHEANMPNFYGSACWGDAICAVPWTVWTFTGDRDILAENLPAMVRWIGYLTSMSPDGVRHPPTRIVERGFTFGDWVQPQGSTVKPNPNTGDDFVATAYYFASTRTVARAARILGETAIAEQHEALADKIKAAFQREFITPTGRLLYNSQGAYVFAFANDLIPEQWHDKAIEDFKRAIYRTGGLNEPGLQLGTGIIATAQLLPTLSKIGLHDIAIKLLLVETSPGWLYQVKRGATTIWERWDGIDLEGTPATSMNSYNHYAYGAVVYWFYHHLAGIQADPQAPGFGSIIIAPEFHAELAPLQASHDTRYGRIEAGWQVDNEGRVTYSFTTPPGTKARLKLPAGAADITMDDRALSREEAARSLSQEGLPVSPGRRTVTLRLAA